MDCLDRLSEIDMRVISGGLRGDEVEWFTRQRVALERRHAPDPPGSGGGEPDPLVAAHRASYDPARWVEFVPWLPELAAEGGGDRRSGLTRADVVTIAGRRPPGDGWIPLLTACYVWGYGLDRRGPTRLGWVFQGGPRGSERFGDPALLERIDERLDAAVHTLRRSGPERAYRQLCFNDPVAGLGPAFATKFLYFAGKGRPAPERPERLAIILDARRAKRMECLWSRRGTAPGGHAGDTEWVWRPPRWSSHRYCVYLKFLSMAAGQLNTPRCRWTPDLVELLLFVAEPPACREIRTGHVRRAAARLPDPRASMPRGVGTG